MYWILLPKLGGPFIDLYYVVHNIMKDRTRKGMGVIKHLTPISLKTEEKMGTAWVLGEDTPDKLVKTVLFLIGVNFALHKGEEHKCLKHLGCDPQIVNHIDDDGFECLKFTNDPYSKMNQGDLSKALTEPKVIYCYRRKDESCCLIRLHNKYIGLLPKMLKAKCLYLRSKRHPMPNQWYIDNSLGINSTRLVINQLAEIAGLPKGNYRNQSGWSSTCMFADKQDEQVICHVSGHRSTAVRTYKHVIDDIRRSASESIQEPMVKPNGNAEMKTKINASKASAIVSKPDSDSELDEFVPSLKEIQTVSEVGNICDMIIKVASQKKYKKIQLNVEFSDD